MATVLILSTIVLVLICTLLDKYFTRNFNYWKSKNVFYINPIPLLGNMLPALTMKTTLGEWLGDLSHKIKKDYFGIFVFDQPVLVVQSPKLVKLILQKDFEYFQNRSSAHYEHDPILSNFMFIAKNPQWKAVRSKFSPVFSTGKLKQMFSHILNEANLMVDYVSNLANVPNVESKEICAKFSTNVIARCAFAIDAGCFNTENAEFRYLGRQLFDFRYSTAFRLFSGFLAPKLANALDISLFDPRVLNRLSSIFGEILSSRISTPELKGKDLIDIIIEESKNKNVHFDQNVMMAQALQFFAAGFESVSAILSFTLYELCVNPQLQDRLRTEIFENLEKHDGITCEGVSEMKFLDMCIAETLRKYPALPFLDRTCLRDYKVENSDLVIEKATAVYIPMFALHYNPEFFPQPEKYDPQRFADKSKINKEGLYYVPFGDGPRICIGNRFGLLTVKIGLVSLLSNYKLEATSQTPRPIKFEPKALILQSNVGVPLKFVPF
ncbi:cytochrome P450 6k1 [Dendroctonus ponderosae]|nr:cytochrome P450 6k1 [Dendroctonus ponderosae]XP_048518068.1 cytochrome P450 6k1 [Dendroctonus ponderosae]